MIGSNDKTGTTMLGRILSWPSHHAFLVCFLFGGVLLCAGSFILHIGDLPSPAGAPYSCNATESCDQRQVGYLWAPNWSFTYAILGPLALFLMLESLKGARQALDYLFEAEMVRDEEMIPLQGRLSTRAWEGGTRARNWFLVICAGLVPAGIAYSEWYPHNLVRLIQGGCADCKPDDYDWGLAAIIRGVGSPPNWVANAIFDFLAFTAEALLISAAVACFLYLLDLKEVIPGPDSRLKGFLLPNLRSKDPRRGFEKFEEPLQLMLNACLTFFLICYSIRVNRMYMRSVGYHSLGNFIQEDILGLVAKKVTEQKGSELLAVLFSVPSGSTYQEFLGGVALLLIALFSFGTVSLTVGQAAGRARANALEHYQRRDPKKLFELSVKEEKDRAEKMKTWPLEWRYFQLDALLAIMGMALLSLWFYKIGFYVVLLVVATLLLRFRKALGGSDDKKHVSGSERNSSGSDGAQQRDPDGGDSVGSEN